MSVRVLAALALVASTAATQAQVGEPRRPTELDIAPACENIPFDRANCVRVLACIGEDGLWFDGEARGWDTGTVAGRISDGTTCEGTWDLDGPGGAGQARLACEGGLEIGVIYTQQHNETGTVMGSGVDSLNRPVRVWSGLHVLRFLTPEGQVRAALQCGDAPIPIS
ncbi:MAG: hypothetical protein AAF390_06225 [Pseudomonadota bacterium]